jgi:two-component system sensor histidine kinase TctE
LVITLTSPPDLQASTSVRRLLFRWLLLPLVLLLGIATIIGYPIALKPATAAYDWVLIDTAQSLTRLINSRRDSTPELLSSSADILLRTDQFDRIYYSVHDLRGKLLAGDSHLSPPPIRLLDAGEYLYDGRMGGEVIRVAAMRVTLRGIPAIVQVAETTVKRNVLTTQILTAMIASEVVIVIVVVVLMLFGIGKGLEPLERLREEIEARSHRDLRPVPPERAPIEVRPVVSALNDLLRQLEMTLRSQQEFVANAAHQLRTPLAGLRMQVELGLQQQDPAEQRRVLTALGLSTERTVHLANQLLMLARAEVGFHRVEAKQIMDLRQVVEDVAGNLMPAAIAKKIDLGLELQPAQIHGDPFLMAELLSNLIDNAIAYTPAGGRITVATTTADGFAVLQVEDDGIGIPEAERELVFKRFYRINGSSGEGCGLGLPIVQEITHLHGGEVVISKPSCGKGTLVAVRIPAAA